MRSQPSLSARTTNGQIPENGYTTSLSPMRSAKRILLDGLVCRTFSPIHDFCWAASGAGTTRAAIKLSCLRKRCQVFMDVLRVASMEVTKRAAISAVFNWQLSHFCLFPCPQGGGGRNAHRALKT